MLKVAIISPCMGRYGGLEGFVLTLGAAIARLPGFKVEVIFKRVGVFEMHGDLEASILESGAEVYFCDRGSRLLWQRIRQADVVHVQNLSPDLIVMARLLSKPTLATVHARSTGVKSLHQRVWHVMRKLATRRFYISEFVRQSWEGSEPKLGSQVVHSICRLPEAPAPWEDRRGFAFVSRFIANKGLEQLLPAYLASGLDPMEWPLHLVGAGPLESWVKAFVERHQIRGVKLHGFVSEAEKHEVMGRARFVVVPPNTQEDFGLVPLEARSLRVPCLITRDGGVPEAAGAHCLSCEPGDVDGLATLLREAVSMSEADYRHLATAAHDSLEGELVRPEFYAETYREMLVGGGMRRANKRYEK
jgi:glycosyltransferase involved in cell wall biosynthesis